MENSLRLSSVIAYARSTFEAFAWFSSEWHPLGLFQHDSAIKPLSQTLDFRIPFPFPPPPSLISLSLSLIRGGGSRGAGGGECSASLRQHLKLFGIDAKTRERRRGRRRGGEGARVLSAWVLGRSEDGRPSMPVPVAPLGLRVEQRGILATAAVMVM